MGWKSSLKNLDFRISRSLLSKASSLETWHFWSQACLLSLFCKPGVGRNFVKILSHLQDNYPGYSCCDSCYQVPTLRIWSWWKDMVCHWCVPAGLVKSHQCQYKDQDWYQMYLYTQIGCVPTLVPLIAEKFIKKNETNTLRLTSLDQFNPGN